MAFTDTLGEVSRGFTLAEMLLVVIVIAVLAAIAVPRLASHPQRSRESALRETLREVRLAVERHYHDTGCHPKYLTRLYRDRAFVQSETSMDCYLPDKSSTTYRRIEDFLGPYLSTQGALPNSNPIDDAKSGSTSVGAGMWMPKDPVSGLPLRWRLVGGQPKVSSSATGADSQGVSFSSY